MLIFRNKLKSESDLYIFRAEGVQNILSYHGGKVSTTLTDLYPDIGLRKSNFKRGDSEAYKSWKDERECRKLFDTLAYQSRDETR